MTIDKAFAEGLRLFREALGDKGHLVKGSDVQVLAAHRVFEKRSRGLEHDERFPSQGPAYAKMLIASAYATD